MNYVFCSQQVISSGNASVLCLGGAWFESWEQLSWLKFVVQLLSLEADASVIFSIRPRQIPSTPFQFIIHCHAFILWYGTRVTMSFNELQTQKHILVVTVLY